MRIRSKKGSDLVLIRGAAGAVRLVVAAAFGIGLGGIGSISAQTATPISTLEISLWPEYDDPRVLVILAGTLEVEEGTLILPLPEGADLNAVAYAEEDAPLTNAEWEVDPWDGGMVLVVRLPAARFQVEYYLDAIEPGDETLISVAIPAPDAPVAEARLQVQQPAAATALSGDPTLSEPQLGFAGLTYLGRDLGPLSGGDLILQEVRYVRLAPGLSAPPAATTPAPVPSPVGSGQPDLRLLGAGAAAVVGVSLLFFWFRTGRGLPFRVATAQPGRRDTKVRYCHNCGHSFQPADRYCAQCGTARRS